MSTQTNLEIFNTIYDSTYTNTLKFIILHCNSLDDVNDLLQDTYLEFYKSLKKKKIKDIENSGAYIIGIAKNILKKHYRFKYKNSNIISFFQNEEQNLEIPDNFFDLESNLITEENIKIIWNYLENKDLKIAKVFYLYYCLDMKISDIANELNCNESTIKNYIFRTIKELKKEFMKEGDENA